jgi:RNA polymerase sigma factor (sigma-70 family)
MWDASDEALLAGMAADDRDATLAFIRRVQQRVYGLARIVTGDPYLAEDVAQEAFLRAWRSAASYDTRRGTVAAWITTITRNLAIDAVRLRRATPVDPEEVLAQLLLAPGPGPADAAEAADSASCLRDALADLPVEQRRAVVLAVYLGRTAREVGEGEGVPLGTAKTRIRTGLLRLRAALEITASEWTA